MCEDFQQKVNASLIYQINLSGVDYRAKKLGHSSTGISFKSYYDLKPGTIVYIRHECCPPNCPGGKACESCRMVTLATVKWCRKIANEGMDSYFVCAKYF